MSARRTGGRLQAWLSSQPVGEANLANPNALLFAVPTAVKDTLYGVMPHRR
ncbi:MAG: hypothetical protein IPM31_10865 [Anaerolineae bacterium]|nr:hypothetical protein [Anaerolineae bacterium]